MPRGRPSLVKFLCRPAWRLEGREGSWCLVAKVAERPDLVQLSPSAIQIKIVDAWAPVVLSVPCEAQPIESHAAQCAFSAKRGELTIEWPRATNQTGMKVFSEDASVERVQLAAEAVDAETEVLAHLDQPKETAELGHSHHAKESAKPVPKQALVVSGVDRAGDELRAILIRRRSLVEAAEELEAPQAAVPRATSDASRATNMDITPQVSSTGSQKSMYFDLAICDSEEEEDEVSDEEEFGDGDDCVDFDDRSCYTLQETDSYGSHSHRNSEVADEDALPHGTPPMSARDSDGRTSRPRRRDSFGRRAKEWEALGDEEASSGDLARAQECYACALSILPAESPAYVSFLFKQAVCLHGLGRLAEALEGVERCAELRPDLVRPDWAQRSEPPRVFDISMHSFTRRSGQRYSNHAVLTHRHEQAVRSGDKKLAKRLENELAASKKRLNRASVVGGWRIKTTDAEPEDEFWAADWTTVRRDLSARKSMGSPRMNACVNVSGFSSERPSSDGSSRNDEQLCSHRKSIGSPRMSLNVCGLSSERPSSDGSSRNEEELCSRRKLCSPREIGDVFCPSSSDVSPRKSVGEFSRTSSPRKSVGGG